MSASFPNAKKTFSAVVNGVTKLVAALFNTAYDEIEAEQTFIGAMGSTQANTDSLKNLLLGFRRGCSVDYKGAADLYVRAGEIAIPDASANLRFRRNASDTTVTWADIDTGAEGSSTLYYVYAVADGAGTTFTVKISANVTTPSGCTFYRLIGIFYNDASGNIQEIANLNRNVSLNNWVVKADSTVYQAMTDGFVIVACYVGGAGDLIEIYTDSSNPPTTQRAQCYSYNASKQTLSCLVKKGDYWKIVKTESTIYSIYWIPLS